MILFSLFCNIPLLAVPNSSPENEPKISAVGSSPTKSAALEESIHMLEECEQTDRKHSNHVHAYQTHNRIVALRMEAGFITLNQAKIRFQMLDRAYIMIPPQNVRSEDRQNHKRYHGNTANRLSQVYGDLGETKNAEDAKERSEKLKMEAKQV